MKREKMRGLLAAALCVLLLVSLCVFTACGKTAPEISPASEVTALGSGATDFTLSVIDGDGTETKFLVHTDEQTVGAALSALGVIQGEESEFGLYVKTVNGVTADYDIDGSYWAFYIDGEYASSGVDSTEITSGVLYTLKVEK